jgi:hypothetical protein
MRYSTTSIAPSELGGWVKVTKIPTEIQFDNWCFGTFSAVDLKASTILQAK